MSGATQMTQQRETATTPLYRVFVYGTLKRGGINHARFCQGIHSIEEAAIRGRLFRLSATIPALEIPTDDILAHGTLDYSKELQRQQVQLVLNERKVEDGESWRLIQGELFTFAESERLAQLDRFEGFHPTGHCLYRRVLVPVQTQDGDWVTTWVYTIGDIERKCLESVEADCWR
jgi:gamma-glutamylcyclotransferase (GGCT)/AIG2-like uncharacterized protein YtfP